MPGFTKIVNLILTVPYCRTKLGIQLCVLFQLLHLVFGTVTCRTI